MGFTEKWWNEYNNLPSKQRDKALEIIKTNDFHSIESYTSNKEIIIFLKEHYFIRREDIDNPDSVIFKLKNEYDSHRKSHTHLQFAQADTHSQKLQKSMSCKR